MLVNSAARRSSACGSARVVAGGRLVTVFAALLLILAFVHCKYSLLAGNPAVTAWFGFTFAAAGVAVALAAAVLLLAQPLFMLLLLNAAVDSAVFL